MKRSVPPTENEIKILQSFYNKGNTLDDITKKFGWCKRTLIKVLHVRRARLSDEERRQRRSGKVVTWRRKIKIRLVTYKGGKCEKCGYSRCMASLIFHHRDPKQKSFGITSKSKSFESLKKEVNKCSLLCSNCHGEVHAGLITI